MVSIENLEKELKQDKLHSIYLFSGEELFLLENSVKKIKTIFGELVKGINYINIDETNYKILIQELETPAFGFEKKLIIVKNANIFSKEGKKKNAEMKEYREKLSAYLKENIKMINESIVLVFIEENIDLRYEIIKAVDELGVNTKFEYLKEPQLKARLKAICKGYKVEISENVLTYLLECCGTSMQDLINEIRKLIEYKGENGVIEKEDIDKLSIKKIESIIFELTDNLGKKDVSKSLEVLNNLIYSKEPIQKILITLYNHFKKIYFTGLAVKTNKDIISTLKLKPNQTFLVNKYKTQARYFGEKDLRKILQSLIDLDYNYKNGLIDLQVGLESILCVYCS